MKDDKKRLKKRRSALPPWLGTSHREFSRRTMAAVFGTALAVASATLVALSLNATADAAPARHGHGRHLHSHHTYRAHAVRPVRWTRHSRRARQLVYGPGMDAQASANFGQPAYPGADSGSNYAMQNEATGTRRQARRIRLASADANAAMSMAAAGGAGGGDLVSTARQYMGTNPTGRGSLWCGAFMDMVLKQTGHPGGGNLARGYAKYGTRIAGPEVGAIVVLGRKGGGHVGVVSGIDSNGNPIVISGNHNRRVAESTYPRSRVLAYVRP